MLPQVLPKGDNRRLGLDKAIGHHASLMATYQANRFIRSSGGACLRAIKGARMEARGGGTDGHGVHG